MPVQTFRLCRNAHGREQSFGIFLPPNAKVELAVNYGGGGGEAALFLYRKLLHNNIKEKKMPEN